MKQYHKLESMNMWVDVLQKILYPSDSSGDIFLKNGISIYELNTNWYSYLDENDKNLLINLYYNGKINPLPLGGGSSNNNRKAK